MYTISKKESTTSTDMSLPLVCLDFFIFSFLSSFYLIKFVLIKSVFVQIPDLRISKRRTGVKGTMLP